MPELTNAPASPAATTGNAPQPTDAASPKGDKPINLHELPEFRQVQAGYDRKMAELQKQLTDLKTAGMDDFERLQFEKQQLQEQLAGIQAEQARRAALEAIATEAGVPVSVIETANDPDEAWRMAIKALRQGGGEQAAPRVDVGGGQAMTPAKNAEAELAAAQRSRDPVAYVRALRKLQTGG